MNIFFTQLYSIRINPFGSTVVFFRPLKRDEHRELKEIFRKEDSVIVTHYLDAELPILLYYNIIEPEDITGIETHRRTIASIELSNGTKIYSTSQFRHEPIAFSVREYKEKILDIIKTVRETARKVGLRGLSLKEMALNYTSLADKGYHRLFTSEKRAVYYTENEEDIPILVPISDDIETIKVDSITVTDVHRTSLYSLLTNNYNEELTKLAKRLSELPDEKIIRTIQKFVPVYILDGSFSEKISRVKTEENKYSDLSIFSNFSTSVDSENILVTTSDEIYTFTIKKKYSQFSKEHNEFLREFFGNILEAFGEDLLYQFQDTFIINHFVKHYSANPELFGKEPGQLKIEDANVDILYVNNDFYEYYIKSEPLVGYDIYRTFINHMDVFYPVDMHIPPFIVTPSGFYEVKPTRWITTLTGFINL